ncbi:hypothetical protein BPNPMPFG_007900 (plasmid) [Mesorhizobium sp. AR07]|uniref:hypothetical protein n=1 Tax=Mesorhizobium sp. AR07 TaxID=2865838 RepID=UPI00215FB051|nr:hypothetical protein [Mesorhizobium sp. AR07]UVK48516.1 hypothetical protein BPNPMPFG_007900 [Mesorhizobium sp. AR07]
MARDYALVLKNIDIPFTVVGRDVERTAVFARDFGCDGISDGVGHAVRIAFRGEVAMPSFAIVATPVDTLAPLTALLADICPQILVEKPGALEAAEMEAIFRHPRIASGVTSVFVGYNRRFLASVNTLRNRLAEEGSVLSASIEFDEPVPRIESLDTNAAIKARWGYANASHVFDLLFYLCGRSVELHTVASQPVDPAIAWHPGHSVFVGSGLTSTGTRYVYHGNYASVGRWRIAMSVPRRRYILMPLETLKMVEGPSVAEQDVPLLYRDDSNLKPGLKGQVEAFLSGDPAARLATAAYQAWHLRHLATVFGYPL